MTKTISGRIRPEHDWWLRNEADRRFDGELSRALRWALDQAQLFTQIMSASDPVTELDMILNPEKYAWDPEEDIAEAERELVEWQREQAIKRAQRKRAAPS
jgi:hypothetical protein